jgi:hypothetical protein
MCLRDIYLVYNFSLGFWTCSDIVCSVRYIHMHNILVLWKRNDNLWHSEINVREYRRDNQNWIIQRNWQHRVHKTKNNNMSGDINVMWRSILSVAYMWGKIALVIQFGSNMTTICA